MLFELRMYHIQPGQRDAYVKWFEEEVVPSQAAKGVVIVGSFVDVQNEDQFVWIRRFDSEEARANNLYKVDTLIASLKEFRKGLVKANKVVKS